MQRKVQYCIERAEQAKRDDVRRWLDAADSWRLAIEYRRTVPDLNPNRSSPGSAGEAAKV